jgi:hypothetical protein
MRRTGTIALIVMGVALLLAGYLLAAPWGASTVADSDPAVVGAPILFIIGIVLLLSSALFYELLPDGR